MSKIRGKIVISQELCKGCRLCVDFCPQSCIVIFDQLNSKGYFPAQFRSNQDSCTGCGICATMCPDVAIEVYRDQE